MPRPKGGSVALTPQHDYTALKDILVPYRRVSTREQAEKGAGLDAQKTTIGFGLGMREATATGWDCVDKGKSGKNLSRPGLNAALKLIEDGQAGGIIVSKLDRLSRSLLDFAWLMAKAEKEGWNIVILDLGVDLRTPAGKAMAQMLAIFAEFERNVIIQRTRDGLAEKRAEGVRLGRRREMPDELMIAIIAAHHATDGGFSPVARYLNVAEVKPVHGGKMWYPSNIQKVVDSPDAKAFMKQFEEMSA